MNYLVEQYHKAAKNYLLSQSAFTAKMSTFPDVDHIYRITTNVLLTRDHKFAGGHFVHAVVNNDLQGAFAHADSEIRDALYFIILAYNNCTVEY